MNPSLSFAVCVLVWGSTWLAIKVGYGGVGALTGAALRFGFAALVLFTLMPLLRVPLPRTRSAWIVIGVVGVFLFAADYGLIYWGEQGLDSGLTAVLFAVLPLLTALLAHVALPNERLTWRKVAGILLGIAGLAVVFSASLRFDPARVPYMLAIVASAGCAAVASVTTRKHAKGLHPVTYTAPAMAVGALGLEGAALLAGEAPALPSTGVAWASVIYLALFGSVLTFLLYFRLLQEWDATRASLVALLTPLVALLLGVLVLEERPGWPALAGTALVLGGVWVATRPQTTAAA